MRKRAFLFLLLVLLPGFAGDNRLRPSFRRNKENIKNLGHFKENAGAQHETSLSRTVNGDDLTGYVSLDGLDRLLPRPEEIAKRLRLQSGEASRDTLARIRKQEKSISPVGVQQPRVVIVEGEAPERKILASELEEIPAGKIGDILHCDRHDMPEQWEDYRLRKWRCINGGRLTEDGRSLWIEAVLPVSVGLKQRNFDYKDRHKESAGTTQ